MTSRPPGPHDNTDAGTLRAEHIGAEPSVDLELVVIEGADRGARCLLASSHASPFLVGQSGTCELRLHDRAVSRRHASFDASGWPVRVTDLSSTNGTFLNGASIVEAHLVGGETLQMGGTTLLAERRAAGPRARLSEQSGFGRVVGGSPAMRRLYPICEQLARTDLPVMLEGEAGTGKELLAESIHEVGPRAASPFVVVDCSAGGRALMKRQRERGDAFDALFAQAQGGTILFDELGELDATLQRALSRVFERPVAARILVATRKNLDWLVQHGRFREDLYATISAARIELPPLRARHGDVRLLAKHFWTKGGGNERAFPDDVIARSESYAWPGNVRELMDVVSKLLTPGTEAAFPAPPGAADMRKASEPPPARLGQVVEDILEADVAYAEARRRLLVAFEQQYVERMLTLHDGNITRAAAASGLARRNFQLIRARRKDEG